MTTDLFGVQVVGAPKPRLHATTAVDHAAKYLGRTTTQDAPIAVNGAPQEAEGLADLDALHIGAAPLERRGHSSAFPDHADALTHARRRTDGDGGAGRAGAYGAEEEEEERGYDEMARLMCDRAAQRRQVGTTALNKHLLRVAREASRKAQVDGLLEQIHAIFENGTSEERTVEGLTAVLSRFAYLLGPDDLLTHLLYKAVEYTQLPTEGALFRAMLNLPETLKHHETSFDMVDWQDMVDGEGRHLYPSFQSNLRRYIEMRVGSAFTRRRDADREAAEVLLSVVDERYPNGPSPIDPGPYPAGRERQASEDAYGGQGRTFGYGSDEWARGQPSYADARARHDERRDLVLGTGRYYRREAQQPDQFSPEAWEQFYRDEAAAQEVPGPSPLFATADYQPGASYW